MDEQKKGNWGIWIGVALIILIALYGAFRYMRRDAAIPTDTTNPTTEIPQETTTSYLYKDGVYKTIGNYTSPGGAEQIDVTLTVKNDVITSATVISLAVRPESKLNQGKFLSGYQTLVVGKKLDEVVLTKVSGSSLTPKGWNEAIAEIQTQAKV